MLFHYHFWTPHVEETEAYYTELGFRVTQRIGKLNGVFFSYDPPLIWEDFREERIIFRIIEMKKGAVNVTFGQGKQIRFDHIGFLVDEVEYTETLNRVKTMGWEIKTNERRTFIQTPYKFRIELQTHHEAIQSVEAPYIEFLQLTLERPGLEEDLIKIFGKPMNSIRTSVGRAVSLNKVCLSGTGQALADPNGINISFS